MHGLEGGLAQATPLASPPTFERFADATLSKVRDTYAGRGLEYGDTWSPDGEYPQVFTRLVKDDPTVDPRVLALAVLCDVKLSRLLGAPLQSVCCHGPVAYNTIVQRGVEDSIVDLIAYMATFLEAVRKIEGAKPDPSDHPH